jgi:hypothetical protein
LAMLELLNEAVPRATHVAVLAKSGPSVHTYLFDRGAECCTGFGTPVGTTLRESDDDLDFGGAGPWVPIGR